MTGSDIRAGRQRYEDWLNSIQAHCVVEQELFVECPMAHPTFMMTRSAYDAVGGYRDVSGPEDYDLVFRMWHAGYELGCLFALARIQWSAFNEFTPLCGAGLSPIETDMVAKVADR